MDLPGVDPAKLVKLRQRLVAPSQFSTQYLFPGSQAFFRDFIIASESNQTFIEQLKAVLIHELLEMNGSSYEVLNVSSSDNQHDCEYVVSASSYILCSFEQIRFVAGGVLRRSEWRLNWSFSVVDRCLELSYSR